MSLVPYVASRGVCGAGAGGGGVHALAVVGLFILQHAGTAGTALDTAQPHVRTPGRAGSGRRAEDTHRIRESPSNTHDMAHSRFMGAGGDQRQRAPPRHVPGGTFPDKRTSVTPPP